MTSTHFSINSYLCSGFWRVRNIEHCFQHSVGIPQLKKTVEELQHRINFVSSRLVRQLKRRDRRIAKLQHNSDLVTAILQASSQKRSKCWESVEKNISRENLNIRSVIILCISLKLEIGKQVTSLGCTNYIVLSVS